MHKLIGAAIILSALSAGPAKAQDAGALEAFVSPESPQCVPVSEIAKVAKVATLTPEQFQFVRALYVAIPPISHRLPPGDHAVLAIAGDNAMVALVGDGATCARMLAPDFLVQMLVQVGEGDSGKAPGVDN